MKTCPYCQTQHNNQEFSEYCDINCVMAHTREYDDACNVLDEQELEKQRNHLKYI